MWTNDWNNKDIHIFRMWSEVAVEMIFWYYTLLQKPSIPECIRNYFPSSFSVCISPSLMNFTESQKSYDVTERCEKQHGGTAARLLDFSGNFEQQKTVCRMKVKSLPNKKFMVKDFIVNMVLPFIVPLFPFIGSLFAKCYRKVLLKVI